jgi:hypothetical protein
MRFYARGDVDRWQAHVADVRVDVLRGQKPAPGLARTARRRFRLCVTSAATVAGVARWSTRLRLPDHISRRRLAPPGSLAGHSPRPFLARGVPGPQLDPPRPRRTAWSFPHADRRRSWGSFPSQVYSRRRVDARGTPRGCTNDAKPRRPICGHFCPSGPTCPLTDHARTPIDFRRGVAPPIEKRIKKAADGDDSIRSGFWAWLPRSVRVVEPDAIRIAQPCRCGNPHRKTRRSFLPWAFPLAGLADTQSARDACGLSPDSASISLRLADLPPAYPLMGITAQVADEKIEQCDARDAGSRGPHDTILSPAGKHEVPRRRRLPFSVLWG